LHGINYIASSASNGILPFRKASRIWLPDKKYELDAFGEALNMGREMVQGPSMQGEQII
jgi:hypothetical protein